MIDLKLTKTNAKWFSIINITVAVAYFIKSTVVHVDKVPYGNTFTFADPKFPYTAVWDRRKCQEPARSVPLFRCNDSLWQTDRQTERRAGRYGQRERGKKFIDHKQINDVTIKIINLCGRLPARKFLSSWPPMLIQIIAYYSICNTTKSNNKTKPI